MATHTPGPWHVQYGRRIYIFDSQKEIIATIPFDPATAREQEDIEEADARLIASAPDLLTALRELVAAIDDGSGLPAAIAHARVTIDEATKT